MELTKEKIKQAANQLASCNKRATDAAIGRILGTSQQAVWKFKKNQIYKLKLTSSYYDWEVE